MNLFLNGEVMEVPRSVVTVFDLLKEFGINDNLVMIEVENQIVEKKEYHQVILKEGNRIEVVHFVGGG